MHSFGHWFGSLSLMYVVFFHIVTYARVCFLLEAETYSTQCTFSPSSVDWHWDCMHILATYCEDGIMSMDGHVSV